MVIWASVHTCTCMKKPARGPFLQCSAWFCFYWLGQTVFLLREPTWSISHSFLTSDCLLNKWYFSMFL
jgi:hypothetical protein